jgi:cytochrome c556
VFFRICFSLLLLASFFCNLSFVAPVRAGGGPIPPTIKVRSTMALKQVMGKFGALLAGLEILRMKEKKIDWEAVNVTLNELSQALDEMRKADSTNAYKEYTDILAAGMVELKDQAQKQNKNFFKSVDKLMESCFKCHAAHRPGDYLIPKDQRISASSPN